MAKASIHVAKGSAGFVTHNDRTTDTINAIFNDEENEYSATAQEAFATYRQELRERSEAYTQRTGQALQKNTTTHLSAIVNLNAEHTLEDLQPLIEHLEESLDTKVFQVAIHRDEGHIDEETGEAIKNYHAHIEFMGIDSEGASIRRKLDRSFLKDLQSKTADILGMERGQEGSKTKRLDTYEFKTHKKREAETIKELQRENKALKAENEELKYNYREMQKKITALENINNEQKKELHKLNSAVKNGKAEIEDLTQALKEAKEKNMSTGERIQADKELRAKDEKINNLQNKLIEARETIFEQNVTIGMQKAQIEALEAKIEALETKIEELEEKLQERSTMRERQATRKELRETQKELKETEEEFISLNDLDFDLEQIEKATNAFDKIAEELKEEENNQNNGEHTLGM